MVTTVLPTLYPSFSQQITLFGEKKELWYCIHCNYVGYKYETRITEEGKYTFEICPKCEWVCYSDTEVREGFLRSNIYPKLVEKYCKVHKIRYVKVE